MTTRRLDRFSPEVRQRAVMMVLEFGVPPSQMAIELIARRVGCSAPALREWVRQWQRTSADRAAMTADERRRLRALERENRELKRTNDLLRKAAACFVEAALERNNKGRSR